MTYRSRLLIYVGMLIVLLVGMMTLSFKAARDVIVEGAEEHLRHAAFRKKAGIDAELQQLNHYTDIVASDLRLQEYLYIILELDTGADGLASYFERQFGSLPADRSLILDRDGEVLIGSQYPVLVEQVRRHLDANGGEHFFYASPKGVVMVAVRPVLYQGKRLGVSAVACLLDQPWLGAQERPGSDYMLFFEHRGRILWSSRPQYQGLLVHDHEQFHLHDSDDYYKLREIDYSDSGADLPRMWLGISEWRLIEMLGNYERWLYVFAALGSFTVLLVGWLMLRNFSRPLEQLMYTTEEMINGRLPVIVRSDARTEMDLLVNRFADVLDALRREQRKVQRAHRKLQETAITDSLTGLYNRRYLQEVTPGLFAQIVRDGRYLTAVLLDLDYFKAINDRHGHLGGDAVLVHFARLLKHNSRANDFLFRIGGEEFLILNVAANPAESVALANKIRELVSDSPAHYQGTEIALTVSAGISCCSGRGGRDFSLSGLMRSADKALYEAKSLGRNCVVTHSSCAEFAAVKTLKQPVKLTVIGKPPREEQER